MLQLQLSFRNLNDSDVLSFSDPIAIVFHAVVPHHGSPVWSEVGRTECKHNSMNPNFSQKVIIAVHPTPALEENEPGSGLLRVDVFDMDDHRVQPAQFDPFKDACDWMGGLCISERSITLRMFGEAEKLSKLSLFANMSRVGRIASGALPSLPAQSPLEFNFMLASTPTAFCILTCCLVESDQDSPFQPLEALESSAQSKYPRTIEDRLEPRTAGVLHVLTDRDALIIQQVPPLPFASCCVLRVCSLLHCWFPYTERPCPPALQSIAAYTYSSTSPAFVKSHRAARLLFMSDWAALKVTMMELVHLAREWPHYFYGFRSVHRLCEAVVRSSACLKSHGILLLQCAWRAALELPIQWLLVFSGRSAEDRQRQRAGFGQRLAA